MDQKVIHVAENYDLHVVEYHQYVHESMDFLKTFFI